MVEIKPSTKNRIIGEEKFERASDKNSISKPDYLTTQKIRKEIKNLCSVVNDFWVA
jgi:hypothetical protein